jgi:uncharacterized iron-regulated membrane protein
MIMLVVVGVFLVWLWRPKKKPKIFLVESADWSKALRRKNGNN